MAGPGFEPQGEPARDIVCFPRVDANGCIGIATSASRSRSSIWGMASRRHGAPATDMAGLRHRRAEIWLAGVRTARRTARGIVSPPHVDPQGCIGIARLQRLKIASQGFSRPGDYCVRELSHPRDPCVPRVADGYSTSVDRRAHLRLRHPEPRGMSDPSRALGPSGPAAPSGQSNGLVRHLRRRLASCASDADHRCGARSHGRSQASRHDRTAGRCRRPASDRRHGRGARPGWVPPPARFSAAESGLLRPPGRASSGEGVGLSRIRAPSDLTEASDRREIAPYSKG